MITDSDTIVNLSQPFSKPNHVKQIFSSNCILCDSVSGTDFCNACFANLPRQTGNHCTICSKNIAYNQDQSCGACLKEPPVFSATVAALNYTFPVDAMIHALKYRLQLTIAPILANLLIDRIKVTTMNELPDAIIPMPLHPKRLHERGFNQALEISRYIARQLDIKLLPESCSRIKDTPPQAGLPWKMRSKNVKNVFGGTDNLSDMHLVVIDDVMTTGATLNALAHQLQKQGASKITNWVIARAQTDQFFTESGSNF